MLVTKKDLMRNNIHLDLDDNGQPHVYKYGKWKRNAKPSLHELMPYASVNHHKFGVDRAYLYITLHLDCAHTTIGLSRLTYIWFKGDIPEGLQVDHIDNCTFNNCPANLQLLTLHQNLEKRILSQAEINRKWQCNKKSCENCEVKKGWEKAYVSMECKLHR